MNAKRLVALMLSATLIMQTTPVKAIDWQNDVNVTEDGSGNQIATPDWYEEGTAPKPLLMQSQTIGVENREKIHYWSKYETENGYVDATYSGESTETISNKTTYVFYKHMYVIDGGPHGYFTWSKNSWMGTCSYYSEPDEFLKLLSTGSCYLKATGTAVGEDTPLEVKSYEIKYGDVILKGTRHYAKRTKVISSYITGVQSSDYNAYPQDGLKNEYSEEDNWYYDYWYTYNGYDECSCQLHEPTFVGKTLTTKSTNLTSTTNLDHSTCKLHPSGVSVTTNYSVISGQATISGTTLNLTATVDGVYPVVVRCASTAYGITKYTDAIFTFNIDTKAPVITVNAPSDWQGNDYNLAVTATDQSGIATLTYTDNGGAAQPVINGNIPVTTTGVHNIKITATDTKGLSSSVTRTIKIDKEKPTVTNVTFQKINALEQVINALTGGNFNDTVKVTITATDTNSGVKKLSYQLEGQSGFTDLSSSNSFNISPDYNGYVKIIATDNAENPSDVYTTGKLIIEQTPPKLELNYNDIWQKEKAVIEVVALDEGASVSGLDTVTYTTDEIVPQSGAVSGGKITLTNNGEYEVTVTATDKAKNATVKNQRVRIDKAVPEIQVTGYESGTWIDHDAVFSLSNLTNNISGMTYQYTTSTDGMNWTAWKDTTASHVVTESKKVKFRAVSGAGLVSAESSAHDVKIDREKPVIENVTFQKISTLEQIINALTGGDFNDTVKVTITATDTNSGIKKLSYQLEGQSGYIDLGSVNSFNISPDYDGYVKIIARDNANNLSDVYTTGKLVIEQTPPKLELNYNDVWQKEKAVIDVTALDEGAVISGLDTVTYTTDEAVPQSGAVSDGKIILVNDGDYQVTVTAKDKAENPIVKNQKVRIDKAVPKIEATGYESGTWIDHDAVFSLSNLTNNISGYKYQFATSTDGTYWTAWADTTASHTVTESKKIKFRAVSGADILSADSSVYDVKIDREKPTNVSINIALKNTSIVSRALNGYYPDSVIVSFASTDVGSGLKEIQYQLSDTATASPEKWLIVPEGNKIEINNEYKGFVISRAIDNAGNIGEVTSMPITVDKQLPKLQITTPINGANDVGIASEIVLQSNEAVQKGDGYLTIYSADTDKKYTDIHVSNNRVKISADGKTISVMLLNTLEQNKNYYIVVDKDFVRDFSGNSSEMLGGKDVSSFTTKANDNTVVIMGYKVDVFEDASRTQLLESVNAIADRTIQNKFNVVAKDINNDGMYLNILPTYSAKVENLKVTSDNSNVTSTIKDNSILVDIPNNVSLVNLNVSVNNGSDVFALTIFNANFITEVYTEDINATVDEGQIKGAVDVSADLEAPNVTEVKVKLSITKADADDADLEKAQHLIKADGLNLVDTAMDIQMQKLIKTSNSLDTETDITNTQNPIEIEIAIPEEFKNAATFEIVRIHNGVAETLKATRVGDKIVFETDRFSTYFISYKTAPKKKHKNTSTSKGQLGRLLYDGLDVPYCMSNGIRAIAPISMVYNDYVYFIAPVDGEYKLMKNDKQFEDIIGTWSESNIKNVTARELFNGVDDKHFAPNMGMTRAMFATVMARLDNADLSTYRDKSEFSDVPIDAWYSASVAWAVNNNILQGVGDNRFAPYREITREEIATILSRYTAFKDYALSQDAKQAEFEDKNDVSAWAIDDAQKIQKAGIIEGYEDNTFKPQAIAKRCEAAAMFKRFISAILKNKI